MDHITYLSLLYSISTVYVQKMDVLRRDTYEDRYPAIALALPELEYLPKMVRYLLIVLDAKKILERSIRNDLKAICRELKKEIAESTVPLSEAMSVKILALREEAQIMFPAEPLLIAIEKSRKIERTAIWFGELFRDEVDVFDRGLKSVRRLVSEIEEKYPEVKDLQGKINSSWHPSEFSPIKANLKRLHGRSLRI